MYARRVSLQLKPNSAAEFTQRLETEIIPMLRKQKGFQDEITFVAPDGAAEKPDQGEVTGVGKGKRTDEGQLVPLDVKVGDRVLFGKYSGQTVRVKGDELLVMREEDILGVVEGQQ